MVPGNPGKCPIWKLCHRLRRRSYPAVLPFNITVCFLGQVNVNSFTISLIPRMQLPEVSNDREGMAGVYQLVCIVYLVLRQIYRFSDGFAVKGPCAFPLSQRTTRGHFASFECPFSEHLPRKLLRMSVAFTSFLFGKGAYVHMGIVDAVSHKAFT